MIAKYYLQNLCDFYSYDYEDCIRRITYFDSFELYHTFEGFCLHFNRAENTLVFMDPYGNKWIYTGKDDTEYECEQYHYKIVFLSGATLYDNGFHIKHTQTAEEIFNIAARYFSRFIKNKVNIFTNPYNEIYPSFPIELFSPLAHLRYRSPIIVQHAEAGNNFLDYCFKMRNKETKASLIENYSLGSYINFTDDSGNSWMHTEHGNASFVIINESEHESFTLNKGEMRYNEENDTYHFFMTTKEGVYRKALDYFSNYIENAFANYHIDPTQLITN
ncbi:hypothetical protein VUJ46_00985 [Chryseobacterium sp. MYb264]|uniref:hypothetical protein n=1 Tax=Chryseobacterium sp. MYb264 TaxID=2745153 RepID=UPI002E0DA08D|nr:hypothetical protein VUJ46_00985 [Chryseobacterium sp. MYb264]